MVIKKAIILTMAINIINIVVVIFVWFTILMTLGQPAPLARMARREPAE